MDLWTAIVLGVVLAATTRLKVTVPFLILSLAARFLSLIHI